MYANLIALLMARLPQFENEEGQGMAEYGLILALVAIAAIVLLTSMGTDIAAKFGDISTELNK